MRPLRFSLNVTLDGCYDHRVGIPDEDLHHHAAAEIARADAMIFGRVTYQRMEEAWRPSSDGALPGWIEAWMEPFVRSIDGVKKYVVSNTLSKVGWNAELVRGDPVDFVRRLKNQPGRALAVGGVQLAFTLTEHRLIDEYEFIVHPRVVGHGPTLFAGLTNRLDLEFVDSVPLRSGAVAMQYRLKPA